MKPKAIYIGILWSIIVVFINYSQQNEFPAIEGPYLGQNLLGKTAELLAQDVASPDCWKLHGSPFIPSLSLTQDKKIEYQVM